MTKKCALFLYAAILLILPLLGKTTILKNVSLYMPNGSLQSDSFIVIHDEKIEKIGLMKDAPKQIYDNDFDLKGHYVYPALIDSFNTTLFDKHDKRPAEEAGDRRVERAIDKNTRKALDERNYFIMRKAALQLKLNRAELDKIIAKGFAIAHVVPESGIIGGSSAVVSLAGEKARDAVLLAERFMTLTFNANATLYPTTMSSIYAEMRQLREDARYHRELQKNQFASPSLRSKYEPELDTLLPYFNNEKRLLIQVRTITEQRLFELLKQELNINPVAVLYSDVWRRRVDAKLDVILPLSFKAPTGSVYAVKGEEAKKIAEETLYPQKLAEFIKNRDNIVICAPDNGDYATLFKNIRALIKLGVPEDKLIRALTINPAALLGIARQTGACEPGKLANLIVVNDKLFADKAKIRKAWVDGILFEFNEEKKGEPPAANLSGTWKVKSQSAMGDLEMKMKLEQDGNNFSGTISSPAGIITIDNGFIAGKAVSFSSTANIMGQQVTLVFNGTVENNRLEGKLNLGTLGEATVLAIPDATAMGGDA